MIGLTVTDLDICECGDYRNEHADKTGPCLLNWDHNDLEGKCQSFRLWIPATEKDLSDYQFRVDSC